jgi:hypothetical protein
MKHVVKKDVHIWKDRFNVNHIIEQMETRHLFYTVRMIWNHSAPKELKLRPYQKYNFSEFYSHDYIAGCIRNMLTELLCRSDIKFSWRQEVEFMIGVATGTKVGRKFLKMDD